MAYVIINTICDGCGECEGYCEEGAIEEYQEVYRIDPEMCTDCGSCADVCPVDAITAN